MQYFGKRSLSSAISILLKVIFYLSIIGTTLGFISLIILRFVNFKTSNMFWKFSMSGLTIEMAQEKHFPILILLFYSGIAALGILLVYKLMKLFNNFSRELVFSNENFQLLRSSGFLIVLLGILKSLMNYINWNIFLNNTDMGTRSFNVHLSLTEPWNIISKTVEMDTYSMSYTMISEPGLIIIGLSILFFSHLFQVALKLKNEIDLTI